MVTAPVFFVFRAVLGVMNNAPGSDRPQDCGEKVKGWLADFGTCALCSLLSSHACPGAAAAAGAARRPRGDDGAATAGAAPPSAAWRRPRRRACGTCAAYRGWRPRRGRRRCRTRRDWSANDRPDDRLWRAPGGGRQREGNSRFGVQATCRQRCGLTGDAGRWLPPLDAAEELPQVFCVGFGKEGARVERLPHRLQAVGCRWEGARGCSYRCRCPHQYAAGAGQNHRGVGRRNHFRLGQRDGCRHHLVMIHLRRCDEPVVIAGAAEWQGDTV